MKLIGEQREGEPDGDAGDGRTILVGVKLDPESKELLTWALVKVAEPGDHVIALHVLDSLTDDKASFLSLVKTFDSVLSVYEGFCNLKQVDLKLKVSRGSPVRKLLKREVKSFGSATLILGVSKSHHRIRSSTSIAKYCARKLSNSFTILAINNGKIIFKREATDNNGAQLLENDDDKNHDSLARKSVDQSNDSRATVSMNAFHDCLEKSFPDCSKNKNTLKRKCSSSCAPPLSVPETSEIPKSTEDLSHHDGMDNSLALVPFQSPCRFSNTSSCVAQGSMQLKSGWPSLRRRFLSRRQNKGNLDKRTSVLQCVSRKPCCTSSASVYPDQKQSNSDQNQETCSVPLDGKNGAILLFEGGSSVLCPLPSPCKNLESLPKELLDLHNKYSSNCRLFTYQELSLATSNFLPENLVGKGGSSHVYRGKLSDGGDLAVKILKPSGDVLNEFIQEIEIITTLNHKNIISLVGFCFEDNHLVLVYDFLSRGSLEENLHGNKKDMDSFGCQERFKVALSVAEALDYLHNGCEEPVIHRDVKSSNILLSDDFEPQLSDFGFSGRASSLSYVSCTDVGGTIGYLAPEYFLHGKISDKIDVYAFGVVLLELLSGRKPIYSENPKGQESLVMWAEAISKEDKAFQLLDPSLGGDYDDDQIGRMLLAALLCIRRAPKARPQISLILKLLQGDEEITDWARQQVDDPKEVDVIDEEPFPTNIQSYLNLALLDLEDDSISISSGEQRISMEDYLRGRWSRSVSFDS